jgi:pyruvate formate lyase activating enzyme
MTNTNPTQPRRIDRADPDLFRQLTDLRKPISGETALAEIINPLVTEGTLYESLPDDAVHCFACGHNCTIKSGARGICQVRYNLGGKLYVPWGYVAALQCDPIEKKPFNHVLPGTDTVTFGMLGCDLHCAYCFTGDTPVVTNHGPVPFVRLFEMASRIDHRADGDVAYVDGLQAVAGSGQWRDVRAVFRHPYKGILINVRAEQIGGFCCTPDHKIYATTSPEDIPTKIAASELTPGHYLVIPAPVAAGMPVPALAMGRESTERAQAVAVCRDDFAFIRISEIAQLDHDGDVYNMEVEVEHNYLANFFLVSNCQNWDISQALRDSEAGRPPAEVTPQEMVMLAKRNGAGSVTSSYNEPLITSEWAVAIFKEAKAAGLPCNYVSNGNATREVLEFIRPYVGAYKIDLKTMSDKNYRKLGAVLDHVLDGVRMVHEMGFWLEIVTLVIPGFNDSEDELRDAARFLKSLSPDIPWHVTAFHKDYRMRDPDNTDARTLIRAAEIGKSEGLHYVYAGNMPGRVGAWEHTCCPTCGEALIKRYGYVVLSYDLTADGTCPHCATKIAGLWPKSRRDVRIGTEMDLYARAPRAVR